MRRATGFTSSIACRPGRAGVALATFNERALAQVARAGQVAGTRAATDVAGDETYWSLIQRAFDAERTLINLPLFKKFDVPTLVIHGEDDQVVPVEISAKAVPKGTSRNLPHAPSP